MRLWGNLAIFMLLVWLAPRESTGREKGRQRNKDETQKGVAFRGKFTGQARERCTWTASGEKQYTLNVTCHIRKKPDSSYTCEYSGEPALCPFFISRPHGFWSQISRGLQQQKQHLCKDAHVTVTARTCKRRPKGAHFRLVSPIQKITPTTPAVRTGLQEATPTTECTQRADHGQLAPEKCGSSWGTLCNFLFHIVQSKDC